MSEETQDPPMSDAAWLALVREGRDEGWKRIWERVVEPGSKASVAFQRWRRSFIGCE